MGKKEASLGALLSLHWLASSSLARMIVANDATVKAGLVSITALKTW